MEKAKETRYDKYRKRADKMGLVFSISEEVFNQLIQKPCYYCGVLYPQGSGIDRIKNGHGYLESNVVSCCLYCNLSKRHSTIQEYVARCKAVVNNMNKEKVDFLFEEVKEE